jgi:hypothetical protein
MSSNNAPLVLALSVIAIVLGMLIILYLTFTAQVVIKLMRTKKSDDEIIDFETRVKVFDAAWLKIPYEERRAQSAFNYGLFGRLYKSDKPSDKFMLVLHGHNSSGLGMLKYLPIFKKLGYNVFVPDHRHSGYSGGPSVTFGHYEKFDVETWIDELHKEFPNAEFSIFGESLGAATAIMVASFDKRIKLLIDYCGYANFEELFRPHLKLRVLYALVAPGLKFAAYSLFGVSFKEIDALSAMKKVEAPTLIIHSKNDKIVAFGNALKLSEANPKAETHYFEKSVHAAAMAEYPEEFEKAVAEFVKRA